MFTTYAAPVLFLVSGRDSRRYLNSRLTNNIRDLETGRTVVAAALTAQGRVSGLFQVTAVGPDRFLLRSTEGDAQELRKSVSQFIVADRVELADLSSTHRLLHTTNPPNPDLAVGENGWVVPATRFGGAGWDIVVPMSETARIGAELKDEEIDSDRRFALRFDAALLSIPEDVPADLLFTELPLGHAVSFTKGCYVGQEAVERSTAIGKVPRIVRRTVFPGSVAVGPGDGLSSTEGGAERPAGKVLTSAYDAASGRTLCYAHLKNDEAVLRGPLRLAGVEGAILDEG
jgi:tRNA-modifying protein YgfZ